MKYDVSFCQCGRIHVIPNEKIDNAIYNEKELLLVCGGCGTARKIGADIVPDFYGGTDKNVYEMYSSIVKNVDMTEMGDYSEVIVDEGIRVPMKTGQYATAFNSGIGFSDMIYPDLYEIDRKDITLDEVKDYFNKWRKDRVKVNMKRFISENEDEVLEEISHYGVEGLDWTGTKYEHKF